MSNGNLCNIALTNGACTGEEAQIHNIEMNGSKPTKGKIGIRRGEVDYGSVLIVNDNQFVYDGTEFKKTTDESCFVLDGTSIYRNSTCSERNLVLPGYINNTEVATIKGNNSSCGGPGCTIAINILIIPMTIQNIAQAFQIVGLTSAGIPSSVNTIAFSSFNGNSSLTANIYGKSDINEFKPASIPSGYAIFVGNSVIINYIN